MQKNLQKTRTANCSIGGVESEEHYVFHCVLYETRGRYHCLFKQDNGIKRTRVGALNCSCWNSKRWKDNNMTTTAHQQRNITFFSSITPCRDTHVRSRTGQSKGVPIDWAIAMCCAWRPQLSGPHIHYPCHRQILVIITLQCFPIQHQLMLVNF